MSGLIPEIILALIVICFVFSYQPLIFQLRSEIMGSVPVSVLSYVFIPVGIVSELGWKWS